MPVVHLRAVPAPALSLSKALEERRAILLAMPESEVDRQPKLDASVAAGRVIGVAPRIVRLRAELVALCGAHAGPLVDDLLVVAHATKQADVERDLAVEKIDLAPLHAELRAQHRLLLNDAIALANRELLARNRVERASSPQGYRRLAHNTLVLVGLLRESWTTIADRTPLTSAELDHAARLAERCSEQVGARRHGRMRSDAAELRLRALTALVRHYDELRRMISYLRWHQGDADEIAPSLYARRGRRHPR